MVWWEHRSLRRVWGVTTVLSAIFFTWWAVPRVYAEVRMAVVDLQRALNETEDGRHAKAKLKTLFTKRQQALDKSQSDVKELKNAIDKHKNVLSQAALQERLEAYQKAFVDLQNSYVEYQRELAQKEAELTNGILEKMQEILRRIGQAEGYSLIVEKNEGGVVWVPSHLDLTDRVI